MINGFRFLEIMNFQMNLIFLKEHNIEFDADGNFLGEVKTKEFINWYDNYTKDLYNKLHKNGKEVVNLSFWYSEGDDLSPLMFYDKLSFAMESSPIMQLYLLNQFLKENNIAYINCGEIIAIEEYITLKGA